MQVSILQNHNLLAKFILMVVQCYFLIPLIQIFILQRITGEIIRQKITGEIIRRIKSEVKNHKG